MTKRKSKTKSTQKELHPPLKAESLCRVCDPSQFQFETTDDLERLTPIISLERVVEAVRFGTEIRREGYNLFALGPSGVGKYSSIREYLLQKARNEPTPSDWCYVNDFERTQRARALSFPTGVGLEFKHDLEQLIEELRHVIPGIFEGEDYRTRKQIIEEELRERRDRALEEVQKRAQKLGLTLLKTPEGLAFAPVKEDGEVMSPEEFHQLPEGEREKVSHAIVKMQEELQPVLQQMPKLDKEGRARVKELNRELTGYTVRHSIADLLKKYAPYSKVVEHLEELQKDVVANYDSFVSPPETQVEPVLGVQQSRPTMEASVLLRRYQVNLIVDHAGDVGAPVVYEGNPTYQNLVGQVDHIPSMGALVTDFTLIKPGALHRANGGYLLLDADKVLMSSYTWQGLKRALRSNKIHIESVGQALSLVSTLTLEPDPIPLSVKVILVGEPYLYYLLSQNDPEFLELFKVAVDFEDRIERTEDNDLLYARFIATLAQTDSLRPFGRDAVARVIEYGSRLVEDSERISIHRRMVADLLREADHFAVGNKHETVQASDVQLAIDAQIQRSSRIHKLTLEEIERGTILIDTEGSRTGQINGLSVFSLGEHSFGRPTRITASVRLGRGEVIDIEREVELGGPLHSKGVLILSGFLGARYSLDHPLSLTASLVFEQSYGGIDGDSASSAELYALLSALSEVPIRQSLAATGSVNQLGQIQAIGGVNDKIEGFYEVCRRRGLNGEHGVLIPASNVQHLMLRSEVVDAVKKGLFHIYSVETIDQGIEILTGMPAGKRDPEGNFPEGTLNYLVDTKLLELAKKQSEYSREHSEEMDDEAGT